MFAVLFTADFALQAVLRRRAGAGAEPVALLDPGAAPAVIAALTPAARAAGVALGQTAPQALARCAALRVVVREPSAEVEARAALLAAAGTLSPIVEATAPGVATAAVEGLAPSRRRAALVAACERLAELGLVATGGLAETPLLALQAARAATPECPVHVVESAAHARSFLGALPLAAAEPSPALAAVLAGWGVRTLGDLLALPRAEVVRRLGAEGAAVVTRASGGERRPLRAEPPPQVFAAALELETPVETLEPLLFVLRRLLDRLMLDLARARLAAAAVALRLELEDGGAHRRTLRLPEPTGAAETLFRAVQAHLDTVRTVAPVRALGLEVEPARPLERQPGLFESGLRDPHRFAETLARAAAIVGEGRVGTPVPEDTHRPDAFVLAPPAAAVPAAEAEPVHPWRGLVLRRHRPPLPVRVELAPGGAPVAVWDAGGRRAIVAARGPWRDAGGWWEQAQTWAGEEWDVELAAPGGLHRLRRTAQGWYREGEYD
jgi:protein ImuB